MKTHLKLLPVLLLLFVFSCKDKDKHSETDNLFKFKEYISYNTYGNQSITTDIRVELVKPLEQFDLTQELSADDYLKISPATKGKLIVENGKTLIFQPLEYLKPDTEYTVTVKLDKFYEDISKEFKTYTFSFHTITPNFKVDIGKLQSYSKQWQYVEASIEASDIISLENAKQLVSASHDGKKLKLKWPSDIKEARYFNFTIDSISRKLDDSEILIKWDGKPIGAQNKGENTFAIP
ncbi:MAG: Ig-like domain-containing protein, partial [Aequorivita sp.]|nr:Ig-like domain-containing protein [Aequorivita sp.]